MTLALKVSATDYVVWQGERIDDVGYPLSIEQTYSDDELGVLNLYRIQDADQPADGFMHVDGTQTPQNVNGIVKWVYTDAKIPIPDLLPFQFFSMLALSGKQAALDSFIAGLPEPNKTIATNKLNRSLSFQRDNSLVLAAQDALGLSDSQLDSLWLQAAAIE